MTTVEVIYVLDDVSMYRSTSLKNRERLETGVSTNLNGKRKTNL